MGLEGEICRCCARVSAVRFFKPAAIISLTERRTSLQLTVYLQR
jgi:hypothetical protein